jgi:flagellar biosynthesis component FlhA
MSKAKTVFVTLGATGFFVLMATTAFARSLNFKDAGISLWIFIIIGGMLILLQLIPAGILFFSFIGSASALAFKQKKISGKKETEEEEKQVLPGEPLTAQK